MGVMDSSQIEPFEIARAKSHRVLHWFKGDWANEHRLNLI